MGRIGAAEIIFIVLVIILLFGVKKLPEIGHSIGKAIKEFRKAGRELEEDVTKTTQSKDDSAA
ncbi:MAG: twin-arginine translocase TatA/TatE family subunit [Candidatus Omnitrophica bacterium]|nr:twin-arginine translocase TatA/TatE family subunit [Candidatus Omnitrophota bacterium]MCA9403104.1 twin-arginine translocase TatA/TatE family subunit [Candidatus Omnitrophota bacterium]MCB9720521.1 twin-arginine translocase TatA/TatE family subunit [Candidatus Omnitrophota bacterium]